MNLDQLGVALGAGVNEWNRQRQMNWQADANERAQQQAQQQSAMHELQMREAQRVQDERMATQQATQEFLASDPQTQTALSLGRAIAGVNAGIGLPLYLQGLTDETNAKHYKDTREDAARLLDMRGREVANAEFTARDNSDRGWAQQRTLDKYREGQMFPTELVQRAGLLTTQLQEALKPGGDPAKAEQIANELGVVNHQLLLLGGGGKGSGSETGKEPSVHDVRGEAKYRFEQDLERARQAGNRAMELQIYEAYKRGDYFQMAYAALSRRAGTTSDNANEPPPPPSDKGPSLGESKWLGEAKERLATEIKAMSKEIRRVAEMTDKARGNTAEGAKDHLRYAQALDALNAGDIDAMNTALRGTADQLVWARNPVSDKLHRAFADVVMQQQNLDSAKKTLTPSPPPSPTATPAKVGSGMSFSAFNNAVRKGDVKAMTYAQDKMKNLEQQYGLPRGLLTTLWSIESGQGQRMLSEAGAQGHFQFIPATAKAYGLSNPYDFDESADAAARYLKDLLAQYGGNVEMAAKGYHGGPNQKLWGPKTQNYGMQVADLLGQIRRGRL